MKISCVCPTMPSRAEWLLKAVACFQNQTHEDRELVIVTDPGGYLLLSEAGVDLGDIRIRLVETSAVLSIGAKRNLGNLHAEGDLIAHWDDDDDHAPGRLADQAERLAETGKDVTGYHSLVFSDGTRRWKYSGPPHWAFDASLCYRRSFWQENRLDEINDGLEANFRRAAVQQKRYIFVDAGGLMEVSIHAGNTSPRNVTGEDWTEISA